MSDKKLISDAIDISSFRTLKHSVLVHNNTSQTDQLDASKIRIIEFGPDYIVLTMPNGCCQVSHMLTLYILPGVFKKNLKKLPKDGKSLYGAFTIIGKVSEKTADSTPSNEVSIKVNLTQYDEKIWKALSGKYQEKQEDINDLVKRSKY
jgi:mRNA-degrading endonuclease RelE of RelBE toxin-antitoxin system